MDQHKTPSNGTIHFATSKNGIPVVYDPVNSHATTHFEDTPQLKSLVKEIVEGLELNGDSVATHIDMGRIVGKCDVVDIDENDEIVFGIRKNREDDGLVPFVKHRDGDPCSTVAYALIFKGDRYVLTSAWIGVFDKDDVPFPESSRATERSAVFWRTRAFVYGSQEIIDGTESKTAPWW